MHMLTPKEFDLPADKHYLPLAHGGTMNSSRDRMSPFGVACLEARMLSFTGEEYVVFSYEPRKPLAVVEAHGLTDAEQQVVQLLLAGLSSAQIAERRATSVRTVANQLAAIYRKMGIRSRRELCARLEAERANDLRA